MSTYVILDNGAGKIKYGMYQQDQRSETDNSINYKSKSMSNCTAKIDKQLRSIVGDEVDRFLNGSSLNYIRPFDRGYLNNIACEIDVWTKLFDVNHLNINPANNGLVLTEAPFTPEPLLHEMNEVVYEYFGFNTCIRKPAAWFSAYEFANYFAPNTVQYPKCCTVIDSGFSFSHVFPFIDYQCRKHACRRVNVGGKLLTNYLKEIVSYRQWNMMDEFKLIDQVKEELCYVSTDYISDLANAKAGAKANSYSTQSKDPFGGNLKKFFVLPDFSNISRGFVKPDNEPCSSNEQVLTMENERFSVPEVLFHPVDIGLDMAGIAEATWQSLSQLDTIEMSLCASNIILTGGNVSFPNFSIRFYNELRQFLPDHITDIKVHTLDRPSEYAWDGAYRYVRDRCNEGSNGLNREMVSKAEYLEYGSSHCNFRFQQSW